MKGHSRIGTYPIVTPESCTWCGSYDRFTPRAYGTPQWCQVCEPDNMCYWTIESRNGRLNLASRPVLKMLGHHEHKDRWSCAKCDKLERKHRHVMFFNEQEWDDVEEIVSYNGGLGVLYGSHFIIVEAMPHDEVLERMYGWETADAS